MPTQGYSVQDSASPPPKSRQASTNWCVAASISGFLAVGLGAFGAHVLSGRIAETLLSGFRTAVLYHLVHSVALLALALFGRQRAMAIHWPAGLLLLGITLFSGSLYTMALTGETRLGWLTPIGGVSLLAGWVAVGVCLGRFQRR